MLCRLCVCKVSGEGYRFVYEAETEEDDYGLITDTATKTEDWGGLVGVLIP
jgi:hypothetical protein